MALPHASRPTLTVIDGRQSPAQRADEAHIERIAGLDEAIEGATLAYGIVSSLAVDYQHPSQPIDLRWSRALNAVGRIADRASRARDEIVALTAPDGAA